MDTIAEFARRYGLDAAALRTHVEAGSWPQTCAYLWDSGVNVAELERAELDAITKAVRVHLYSRPFASVAAPETPADAPEATAPETAPEPPQAAQTLPEPADPWAAVIAETNAVTPHTWSN